MHYTQISQRILTITGSPTGGAENNSCTAAQRTSGSGRGTSTVHHETENGKGGRRPVPDKNCPS